MRVRRKLEFVVTIVQAIIISSYFPQAAENTEFFLSIRGTGSKTTCLLPGFQHKKLPIQIIQNLNFLYQTFSTTDARSKMTAIYLRDCFLFY